MPKFIDLTGMKFGRLTVIERAPENTKDGHPRWLCKCECGNTCVVDGKNLRRGDTKSCGCLYGQNHEMSHSKIYRTWKDIKTRCFSPNCKNYHNYGGRGITMFPEWINDFQKFYDYVSKLPHFGEEGYTLDRINNDGNYEPDNLRWADSKTQRRNRRNNIIVEYQGRKMTLSEAAELSGINYDTLIRRYRAGDRGERLFRPVRKNLTENQKLKPTLARKSFR